MEQEFKEILLRFIEVAERMNLINKELSKKVEQVREEQEKLKKTFEQLGFTHEDEGNIS